MRLALATLLLVGCGSPIPSFEDAGPALRSPVLDASASEGGSYAEELPPLESPGGSHVPRNARETVR